MKKIIIPSIILTAKEFLFNLTAFFLPIYLLSIGFGGFEIGILISLFAITALFSSSLTGYLCDRIQINVLVAVSLILLFVFYFSLLFFTSFFILLLIFLVGGIGINIIDIVIPCFVLKCAENKNKGKYVGFFNGTKVFGAACGFLVGGLLIDSINFTSTFKITSILFILLIPFSFFIKNIALSNNSFSKYKMDFFKDKALFLCLIVFLFTLHWGAEGTVYSLFLMNNLGLSIVQSGIFISIPILFLSLFSFFVGNKCDNGVNPLYILCIGLFLSGIGHIVLTYPNIIVAFLSRIIHEIGDAFLLVFIYISVYKLFSKSRIGGLSGVLTSVMVMGRFVGSVIFAPIGTTFGYGWPLAISGAIMLVALIIVYFKKEFIT